MVTFIVVTISCLRTLKLQVCLCKDSVYAYFVIVNCEMYVVYSVCLCVPTKPDVMVGRNVEQYLVASSANTRLTSHVGNQSECCQPVAGNATQPVSDKRPL